MAAALTASLAEPMVVGDLEAARIVHDAIGRLLREGASGEGGKVADPRSGDSRGSDRRAEPAVAREGASRTAGPATIR